MSDPEPQLTKLPPERRWYQFSLRALFGVTCGTAAFFSLARTLGYADAFVILVAILAVVGIMEYPRRVHLATGIVLTLVAGALLWANVRTTKWQNVFNVLPPDQLDSVAKSMFYRGWPIAPFMPCLVRHMQFDASEAGVYAVLVLDAVVSVVILLLVRATCEFCCRRLGRLNIEKRPEKHPPDGNPPPGGWSAEPQVE